MKTPYVVSGRITLNGQLELEERLPLPAGPARISVEVLSTPSGDVVTQPRLMIDETEWKRRKAVMDGAIGCLSDDAAGQILRTIEQEFEQVEPDDWR